jgi:hypothetical protein
VNLWTQGKDQREIDYKKQEVFDTQAERKKKNKKWLMHVEYLLIAVYVFLPALIPELCVCSMHQSVG